MLPRWLAGAAPALLVLSTAARAQEEERIGALALADAARAFAELVEASARDGGALWGRPVAGPVLIVDPASRKVAANQAGEGLAERGGVHVGVLPKEKPIANAPFEWGGVRWAMVMAPYLGGTREERVAVMAHEAFHCVQQELGLYPFGPECAHLDVLEGRVWLQLEWRALAAALGAQGEARTRAVADALAFRAARRALFPEAAASENALEIREGLASYTGLRLAGRGAAEVVAYANERIAKEKSFVRSFAYFSGPLYGYLLDGARATWRAELRADADLGARLAEALALVPAPDGKRAEERAASYGGAELRAAEAERERARQEILARFRAELVDGPVLVLDLTQVKTGTMDTRKVVPFDAGRTVYTERKLVAAWGTLEVHDGAILEDSATRLGRISLRDAAPDRRSGPGWTLELAPGWTIAAGERAGDFVVRPP